MQSNSRISWVPYTTYTTWFKVFCRVIYHSIFFRTEGVSLAEKASAVYISMFFSILIKYPLSIYVYLESSSIGLMPLLYSLYCSSATFFLSAVSSFKFLNLAFFPSSVLQTLLIPQINEKIIKCKCVFPFLEKLGTFQPVIFEMHYCVSDHAQSCISASYYSSCCLFFYICFTLASHPYWWIAGWGMGTLHERMRVGVCGASPWVL